MQLHIFNLWELKPSLGNKWYFLLLYLGSFNEHWKGGWWLRKKLRWNNVDFVRHSINHKMQLVVVNSCLKTGLNLETGVSNSWSNLCKCSPIPSTEYTYCDIGISCILWSITDRIIFNLLLPSYQNHVFFPLVDPRWERSQFSHHLQ